MEQIQLFAETIYTQRLKRIKRTDFEVVEAKLLERFGEEVRRIDTDLVVASQSLNQIVELLMSQNQKISGLQQLMQQPKHQLPNPADQTEALVNLKNELKKNQDRKEQLLVVDQQLQSELDELKKVPRQRRKGIVKKSVVIVLVFTLLSACNLFDSSPSIEKIKKAPENVQELLDPAVPLQSVNKNGQMTYLIYKSVDEVTASLEKQGDKLNIKLKVVPKDSDNIEQHVFKLKIDKETEMIDVLINGKSTPFGVITGS
jgi:hypothetical protein